MEIEVLIRNLHDAFGTGVWVYRKDAVTGRIDVLKSEGLYRWEEYQPGQIMPPPLLNTDSREAEIIFNKFIEAVKTAGYGKDRISVESGELKATKEHLKDMQKLVFEILPKPPVIIQGNPDAPRRESIDSWVRGRLGLSDTESDEVKVKKNHVRAAAKQCSQAKGILNAIFPELFGPGWERETD